MNQRRVRYELRQPLAGAACPAREGKTISRHRTLEGARKAREQRARGAASQGGWSEAVIYDTIDQTVVTLEDVL